MEKIEFDQLDWFSVLPRLGVDPELIAKPKKLGPCPIEGGGKTRFRFDNKGGQGTWICNHCGAGNGLKLIALVNGTDDAGAFHLLREAIGGPMIQRDFRRNYAVSSDTKTPQEIEKARKSLKRAWEKAKPIADTPAQKYLENRVKGIDLGWLAPSFRYNASLFHFDESSAKKSSLPCMISRVVDASKPKSVVTLHRTYLSESGGKANVSSDQVKKLMPATVEKIRGESVKLNTANSEIVIVTEGIENGLAWVAACKNRYSVFAAMNCNNMAKFKWPVGTKFLLVAGDHDSINTKTGLRPGHYNAMILKDRATKSGIKSVVKIPPSEGIDWDDLWNSGELSVFRMHKTKKPIVNPEMV